MIVHRTSRDHAPVTPPPLPPPLLPLLLLLLRMCRCGAPFTCCAAALNNVFVPTEIWCGRKELRVYESEKKLHEIIPGTWYQLYVVTRSLSGTCLGQWRKNELKNTQHSILYNTHKISYYDLMEYLCCSICGSMRVSHSSRYPQVYRSQGQITNAKLGSHSNTTRTNYRSRVMLLRAQLADGRRV